MSEFPEEPLNLPASEGFGYYPAYPGLKVKRGRYKVIRKLGYGPRSSVWLVEDLKCVYCEIYLFIFDYSDPRGDFGLSALKILTAHATLQKTLELKRLRAVKRLRLFYRLPNFHDHFDVHSHHGRHSCFALSVVGSSIEDLRQSLPTKTLPVHVVQKVVGSVLEALYDLHRSRMVHCGPYIAHLFLHKLYRKLTPYLFLFKTAVLPDNICTSVFQRKDDLDPLLATLPPCTIERKVTVDGVEYPIVRSQPIPPYDLDLNDTHIDTGFYLNNLNYGTYWSSTRI